MITKENIIRDKHGKKRIGQKKNKIKKSNKLYIIVFVQQFDIYNDIYTNIYNYNTKHIHFSFFN